MYIFGDVGVMFTKCYQHAFGSRFDVFVCRYKARAMEFLRMRKQWKLQATLTYAVCSSLGNIRNIPADFCFSP